MSEMSVAVLPSGIVPTAEERYKSWLGELVAEQSHLTTRFQLDCYDQSLAPFAETVCNSVLEGGPDESRSYISLYKGDPYFVTVQQGNIANRRNWILRIYRVREAGSVSEPKVCYYASVLLDILLDPAKQNERIMAVNSRQLSEFLSVLPETAVLLNSKLIDGVPIELAETAKGLPQKKTMGHQQRALLLTLCERMFPMSNAKYRELYKKATELRSVDLSTMLSSFGSDELKALCNDPDPLDLDLQHSAQVAAYLRGLTKTPPDDKCSFEELCYIWDIAKNDFSKQDHLTEQAVVLLEEMKRCYFPQRFRMELERQYDVISMQQDPDLISVRALMILTMLLDYEQAQQFWMLLSRCKPDDRKRIFAHVAGRDEPQYHFLQVVFDNVRTCLKKRSLQELEQEEVQLMVLARYDGIFDEKDMLFRPLKLKKRDRFRVADEYFKLIEQDSPEQMKPRLVNDTCYRRAYKRVIASKRRTLHAEFKNSMRDAGRALWELIKTY